jgi:hypothetical protein
MSMHAWIGDEMMFMSDVPTNKTNKSITIPIKLAEKVKKSNLNLSAFVTQQLSDYFGEKTTEEVKEAAETEEKAKHDEFRREVYRLRTVWTLESYKGPRRDRNVRHRCIRELHDKFGIDWYESQALIDGSREP